MATSAEFIERVCSAVSPKWQVRSRKMFGEYMVYVNDKPILLVCDDTVYVKILPELDGILSDAGRGIPYEGSKEHYIIELENAALLNDVIEILEPITKLPKKRKEKTS